jgi:hypothetical protein
MIRLENILTNITRATQRAHEYSLRLKLKSTLYILLSSSFYYTRSIISSNYILSLIIILYSLVYSTTIKLIEI